MYRFMKEMESPQEWEEGTLALTLVEQISMELSAHNWSLRMLSDNSSVPYETIKKIAGGKVNNPSLKNILKISSAFGCSLDRLVGKEEPIL